MDNVHETTGKARDGATEQNDEVTRLRFMTDAAPLLISYVGADLRYQVVNRGYAEWFGKPVAEVIGRTVPEVIGQAAFEKTRHQVEAVLRGQRIVVEMLLPYDEGQRPRHVHLEMIPDMNADGIARGYVVAVTDITGERRAQEELRASLGALRRREREFAALVENSPDIISRFTPDLRCVYTSPAVVAATGMPPEYFIGKTHTEMGMPTAMQEVADASLSYVFATGQPDTITFDLTAPDGGRLYFEGQAVPLFGADGEMVESVVTISRDVTERREAEERQQFLDDLMERTRFSADPDAVVWDTVRSVGEFLSLSRYMFADIDTEADTLVVKRDYVRGVPSMVGVWQLSPWGGVLDELRAGRTVVNRDTQTDPRTSGEWDTVYRSTGLRAYVAVPLFHEGKWVAVFSAHVCGEPRDWTEEEVDLLEAVAQRMWLTQENARLRRAEREAAARQRAFVREMLYSLTEGRLRLCDTEADLPAELAAQSEPIGLSLQTLRVLRKRLEAVAEELRFPAERMQDLETAVGEAGMNAVRHAGGGTGRVHADAATGTIQVWIHDEGKGISVENIHRATLERGFSSAGTLGHGFWMMLHTADRVYLLTGASGTTAVIEQDLTAPEPAWLKDQ